MTPDADKADATAQMRIQQTPAGMEVFEMSNTEKYFVICTDRIQNGEARTVYMNRELGPVLWVANMSEAEKFPSEAAARKFPSHVLEESAGFHEEGKIARTFRIGKVDLSLSSQIDM